jgi:proteic killer suppression protein
VRLILSRLDKAKRPAEMDSTGMKFHALKGDQSGRFSVLVSRNWRITFAWDGTDAVDVDLEDYHGR